jgi:hypothetical protein
MNGKAETFDFLGFTHICGKSKNGKSLPMRRTVRERLRTRLRELKAALIRRRHLPIPIQGAWLASVVRGYFAYHAVPTNVRALQAFRAQTERHWQRALSRRSQRDRPSWGTMRRLSQRWLPKPRILHPWPNGLANGAGASVADVISSLTSRQQRFDTQNRPSPQSPSRPDKPLCGRLRPGSAKRRSRR